ncbi:transcription initiation factor IIA subunit 1-like [Anneissia japonica]|uniref:transcription initiation factor IIA subunit 1-like n=1 Tax=Anneissia japonica TaxID=1529436 RepID=UPI0014257D86|nr:transcription initiation factor IIA subunit 1-like [Anneissia japonica]
MSRTDVSKFYNEIIENVISNVKEEFENEGVDEQILDELKQIWKTKLIQSRALESHEPRYPMSQATAVHNTAANRNFQQKHDAMVAAGKQHGVDLVQPAALSGAAASASIAIQNVPYVNLPTELAATQQSIALPQAAPGTQQPVYRCYQVGDQIVYAVHPPTMQQVQAAVLQQQQQQLQQQQRQLSGPAAQATSAAALSQQHAGVLSTQVGQATLPQQHPGVISTQVGQATLQQIQVQSQAQQPSVLQVDGGNDSSSDEDDFGDDDEDDDDAGKEDDDGEDDGDDLQGAVIEEEPLNTDDDDSGDEPEDIFDTDNVIVCQYEKINRTRNRWKFHLKDGIMNLEGKDWVFHRGIGEADW